MEESADSPQSGGDPNLPQLLKEVRKLPWLYIQNLNPGDMLLIKTTKSTLEMKVLIPGEGRVVLTGSSGELNLKPQFAIMFGSVINPESKNQLYEPGGIAVGFSIILRVAGDDYVTMLNITQEVSVNGRKVLPDLSKIPKKEK